MIVIEVLSDRAAKGLVPHKNKHTLVGVVYRPPQNNKNEFLAELYQWLNKNIKNTKFILLGDMNIDVN